MDNLNLVLDAPNLYPVRECVVACNGKVYGPWGRTLVLCLDGTENQFSNKNSNVLEFFRLLHKDNPDQIAYYQTGLGTYSHPTFISKPVITVTKKFDSAFAWNLEDHVLDGYRFLMQTFQPGDRISLFGFSRGAYTARVLSGFLQKIGLLPRENHAQIPFAWKIFKSSDCDGGLGKCSDYKKTFSFTKIEVDFLGLWDTVASVGIAGKELPFATVSVDRGLRIFRQALALDECRVKFTPNFKLTKAGTPSELKVEGADARETLEKEASGEDAPNGPYRGTTYSPRLLHENPVREVWFAGCHSDVGGGSVPHSTRNSLSRIPLRWMVRECFRMNTGIKFNKESLADIGFGTVPFTNEQLFRRDQRNDPVAVNEKEEQLEDARSPIVDQLLKWYWWIPELFPVALRQQNSRDGQRSKYKRQINLGRGRKIYGDAWDFVEHNGEKQWYIQIHRSVQERMNLWDHTGYIPRARIYSPEGEQESGYCLFVDE